MQRALRTAEVVADRLGLGVQVDSRLTEWELLDRWAGVAWADLPEKFPGELEAYLAAPTDLTFSPESLHAMADRVASAVQELASGYPHGEMVVVSHSAPLRAAALMLTGSPLSGFWDHKPAHCEVTTLRPGSAWRVETVWEPDQI